jgi:hypothetical protein
MSPPPRGSERKPSERSEGFAADVLPPNCLPLMYTVPLRKRIERAS